MRTRAASVAIGAALLALGAVLGAAFAQRYYFRWALEMREEEVVGRANHDILTLSKWRTGSEAQARADLEQAVDTAVATIYASRMAMHRPVSEAVSRMFQLAKVYRTAFPPPANSHPSLNAALGSVAMPEPRYCSPELQKIMSSLSDDSHR